MQELRRESGVSSPSVFFNPQDGLLEIGGESYPENSFEFYSPLAEWLRQFLAEGPAHVLFRVTLTYLNTSSTKCMIDMLEELQAAFSRGTGVSVEWYYDVDNARARETIEEFREDFSMPFEVLPRSY